MHILLVRALILHTPIMHYHIPYNTARNDVAFLHITAFSFPHEPVYNSSIRQGPAGFIRVRKMLFFNSKSDRVARH